MKISRAIAYAVQATAQLAQSSDDSPTPCSKLASEGGMPERFLLQILRNLVTHGLLESTRGVDGGYRLVREPKNITLLEIIEAIEGPLLQGLAPLRNVADGVQEKLTTALEQATARYRDSLTQVTLADLVADPSSGQVSDVPTSSDVLPPSAGPPSSGGEIPQPK